MNPIQTSPRPALSARHQERGVALVIVLGFLVLISALVVAFFSSVQTELTSAKSYAAGSTVKQLAETTTNVVMSQISDATKTFEVTGSPGSGKRLTWASQPGLIHTFDDEGKPNKTFKLYSAWEMVIKNGSAYLPSREVGNEVPGNWSNQPARFTDLNAPVLVPDASGNVTGADGKKYYASYPVLDPEATAEGFEVSSPPGSSANKAPMPVAWLYVLQNGTITSPSGVSSDGLTANWSNLGASSPNKPSATNPIVGRIAFWTDDETSKLNVNTASEPTPWDTPRGLSKFDLAYGKYQPANQEFQRYPGHPYTVALSTVLFPNESQKQTTPALKAAFNKKIYDMVPRVMDGGTRSGTVAVDGGLSQSPVDADRLYASMDEFLFSTSMSGAGLRNLNVGLNSATLSRSNFFLTATSRAPELNLMGLPRISLWPLSTTGTLSAYDKLTAFCSTLGDPLGGATTKYPFYFQRSNPNSPTVDWSTIPRNQTLYNYLKYTTSQAIPGFGSNFKAKFNDDHEQILTEIFDYIRCTNLHDTQKVNGTQVTQYAPRGQVVPIEIGNTRGFGRFHSFSQFGMQFICSQDGPKGLRGGINGTATSTTDPVYDSNQVKLPAGTRAIEAAFLLEPFSPSLGYFRLDEDMSVRVTFLTPMTIDGKALQMTGGVGNMQDKIRDGFHKNGRERGGTGGLRGSVLGFYAGGRYVFSSNVSPRVTVDALNKTTMDFSGGTVKVEVFNGQNAAGPVLQTFTVQIPAGKFPIPRLITEGPGAGRGTSAAGPDWWWRFSTRFSAMTNTPYLPSEKEYPGKAWRTWGNDNDGQPPGFKKGSVIHAFDVVRSIVPKHGDIRLTAAPKDGGSDQFEMVAKTQADWEDANKPMMHIFQESGGSHFQYGNANEPGITSGPEDQLVGDSKITYHYARLPEIKPGAGKVHNKYNDFDNGMACWTDGSYINKPDEGNISASGNLTYPYFSWNFAEPLEVNFSPNRLVPSAGMLGSLPTGVIRKLPWRTLLFRPQRDHPGEGFPVSGPPYQSVPDHLLMDLFWMPIIEPYAISEAFATAGKINMNYEIAPFTYIKRATGLHAVLKGEEPMVIPNEASKYFKIWDHEVNDHAQMPGAATTKDPDMRTQWPKLFAGASPYDKIRWPIDPDATLEQFKTQFENKGIFRSATQICDIHLVRKGESLSAYQSNTVWPTALPTGDNTRERPYANLYAKLTTKSNSFTVHMRVQVLRKRANNQQDAWIENQDQIVSEYRGSSLIERYIDAGARLPDFASTTNSASGSLDDYYKFRVISTKKFAP